MKYVCVGKSSFKNKDKSKDLFTLNLLSAYREESNGLGLAVRQQFVDKETYGKIPTGCVVDIFYQPNGFIDSVVKGKDVPVDVVTAWLK